MKGDLLVPDWQCCMRMWEVREIKQQVLESGMCLKFFSVRAGSSFQYFRGVLNFLRVAFQTWL